MNYIYDVLLNFNEKIYDFYDWNLSDNVYHIRKIPIFKVNSNDLKKIYKNEVEFEKSFYEKINNKTEIYFNKRIGYLRYGCVFSDSVNAIALRFKNKTIEKSSMLLSEIEEACDIVKYLKDEEIPFKIIKVNTNEHYKTRHDIELNSYLTKELNKLKEDNVAKLKYIYYECFDKYEENSNKIILKINKELENNFDLLSNKLYSIIKLMQMSK